MPRTDLIKIREGTTAQWATADAAAGGDPTRLLYAGELGRDTTTGVLKIGDGVTLWGALLPVQAGTYADNPTPGTPKTAVVTTGAQTIAGLKDFTTAPTVNGSPISGASAPLTLTAPVAANVPLTLKGAASQTGDLLKLQSSAAANLARIDSAGRHLIGDDSLGVTAGVIDGFLVISNQDSSKKNFISRGSPRGDGFQYTAYIADGAHFITNGSITSNGESSLFPLLARQSQGVQYMIGMRCDLSPGLDNATLVSDTVNGINHFNGFAQGGGLHPWFQIAWDGSLLWGDGAITSGFTSLARGSDGSMLFGINGAEKVRFDASGKVGIGTASPVVALTVDSAAGDQLRLRSVPNRYRGDLDMGGAGLTLTSYDDTGAVYMPVTVQGSQVLWGISGTEKMRLNTTGDLGVGTNNQQGQLHVITRSNFWPTAVFQGAASQASGLTEWRNSAAAILSVVNAGGAFVSDSAAAGIVLKDTQGTPHYWRVTVGNTGTLTTTDLGTTRPTT